jgi:hypothetical protein
MKILHLIKIQFLLMINKLSFKISFTIILFFCLVCYLINVISVIDSDIFNIYSANSLFALNSYNNYWNIFCNIYPFLLVFPFSFSYIDDLNAKINPYFMGRMGKRNYFVSKMITCFIGGFIIIFIPFIINLILCNLTFPHNNTTFFGAYNLVNYSENLTGINVFINTKQKGLLFLKLYLLSPLAYNLFYITILSIFTGILSMVSLALSFFQSKYKIILFVPIFLFFHLSNILDTISYSSDTYTNYNWMSYLCVDSFYGKNIFLFLCIIITLIILSIMSLIYVCRKERI